MADDPNFFEPPLTARERALQEKIIRLEKRLEGYQSQIDIIDSQRYQLEERAISMESALAKSKKELLDKEIAEREMAEKLKCMTQQAEEYKELFVAERNKNKYSIETLETLLSTVEAEMALRKEFQGFLNEILTEVKEGFYAQLKVVFDKLTAGAENKLRGSPQEMNHSKTLLTTSSSATQLRTFCTAGTTLATSSSSTQHGMFPSSSSSSQHGIFQTAATTTVTSSSPTQYGIFCTAATTTVTSSPTQRGMFCTAATTTVTSSSPTQRGMFCTAATTTVTSSSPTQQGMFDTSKKSFDPMAKSPPKLSWTLEAPKTGFHILNQTTTSSASNTVFGGLQGNASPGNAFAFGKSDGVSVNTSPFKFGISDSGPKNKSLFTFGSDNSGPVNSSPFTFATSNAGTTTFVKSDEGTVNSSPFTFGTTDTTRNVGCSQITFGAPPSARDETSTSEKAAVSAGQMVGGPTELPPTSKPFVLAAFGVSAPAASGHIENDQTKPMFESTPVTTRQMSSKGVKPLTAPNIKGPLKIDSSFFAGLSTTNSPAKLTEQVEDNKTSPTSPPGRTRHDSSASYTEDIHFEPLIPLPEQIEVQTGEEDEEVMFSSRAKLYRYDKEVSAWKERGIGTMKILYNSEKVRSRILMRREVVHKICANHFITDDMKLTDKKGTANVWIWNTFADFSEEVSKPEQLAVKFKSQDDFLLFKEKFEQCQKMKKKGTSKEQETSAISTSQRSSDLMAKFAPKPGSWSCSVCLLTNEERTTVCVACGAAKLSGGTPSALEASKTGFHLFNQTTNSSASNTIFGGLQGNASSGSAFAFGKSDGTSVNTSPFKFGISDSGPKNKSLFTFGSNNSGPVNSSPFTFATSNAGTTTFVKSDEGTVNSSPFTFGMTDTTRNVGCSQITFGAPPSARDDTPTSEKAAVSAGQMVGGPTELPPTSKPFVLAAFGVSAPAASGHIENDQTKPMFESTPVTTRQMSSKGVKPLTAPNIKGPLKIDSSFFAGLSTTNSPAKLTEQVEDNKTSPTSPPGRTRHDSSASYTEDIHFEPLIPLPEQIEVQTGEEDEEVMFSSRAKLYRYDKEVSAWKERGIGTMKILYNSEKVRSRILMRREVVHKICANHFITDDMKLTDKKGTANVWIWNTFADFSEEVSKPEQLAVKFKSQDDFLLFKEKFEKCQKMKKKGTSKEQETSAISTSQRSSDLMAKFAPKPGSWSCSVCLLTNEERTTVCVACGAAKLSGGTPSALEASKTGFHLFNQTTNSSASNTIFGGLQGNASSGSAFAFGKSDGTSVNTSPFKFGISDSGPKNKSLFTFGSNNSGPVNSSPFTFATSNAGTTTFVKSDEGTVNSSPFTFGMTDTTRNVGCSQITFGAPPSARDDTPTSEKAAVSAGQMVGGPTELPPTSKPFVLAAFGVSAPAASGHIENDQTKPMFESTPVTTRQMSSKVVKPLTAPNIKGPLKIDSSFFAGLSTTNSPAKLTEQVEDNKTSPTSPPGRTRHDSSASYTEDIHFEPLIPLPEQIEVQTGEEDEEVMFSSRAKLYRYDKEVSAWKERGIGTMKILYNSEKVRSRILMRREVVHKICANHFITDDMKLTDKKGTANVWIWNTFADFSEEVSKPEQLAVKFKSQDDFLLFKEKFEQCQKMKKKGTSKEQETSAISTSQRSSDLMAKFAPKPGSWSCSVCLLTNEERTTVCVACGAAKLSGGTPSALEASKTGFILFNQTTNSSASNTVFGGLQGNASPGNAFAFGKSDGVSVNTSPFKFGISDSGPKNKSLFTFGSNNSGPINSSPFTFATSNAGTTTFVKSDEGTVNSSPFTFGTTDTTRNVGCSQITFGAPPSARDDTSTSEKAAVSAGQMVGGPTELPPTSKPFVLAAFGVPAIASKTSTASFAFGSSGLTGSSPLSLSMPEKAVAGENAPTVEKSVFSGNTPEQGSAALSFGSFKTGTSPSFDLDLSTHSSSKTQPDPLLSEKYGDVNQVAPDVSQKARVIQNQSQPSFSFGAPTGQNMPEEKLFWQQPTGTFQFGQLDAYAPLGGATSWTAGNNPWRQATQPSSKSEASHIQSALQTSEMFSQPFTLSDFPGSELLRRLAVAKEQQDSANQESQAGGYKFTPYVVYEPAEEASLQRVTNPISTVIVEECDDYDDEAVIEESEDSTDENLSYSSTKGEEDDGENEDSVESSSPMLPIQSSQTQPPFSPSQGKPLTTPLKPVPIHSTLLENAGPANLPPHLTGKRYLTPKSALKATKRQDEDCLLVYEVRSSMANREKASRLFLPSNFFNYTKQELCPGCLGCRRIAKESTKLSKKVDEQSTLESRKEHILEPEKSGSGSASHVFGESSTVGQLTFSSVKPKESDTFSLTQDKSGSKPFQGAGAQLFAEISEGVERQDDDNLHFEPVIPLPDEIQVVTGEEGLEVLFTERAKLYRFDGDSRQWKERGVGDVKLLRHPKSGQGRVLMRREQIKKLCANHNINSGMELKPNVGSDRSWVWYTPADYAEGEARPEKLAIKFKSAEIAGKFREVFEDLKETSSAGLRPEVKVTGEQQGTGCVLYKEFISSFSVSSDIWTCEICYVENSSKDSKCIACNCAYRGGGFPEPLSKTEEEDAKGALTSTNSSVVESIEPNTFQDFNKDSNSGGSIFQSPGVKGLATSQLFTIGRSESSEDKLDDEMYLSPSKTSSPSKQGVTPQTPSTPSFQENVVTSLPFGTNTPAKFTFSLQVSPESSSHKPKSPLSHASPLSPGSPGNAEDDGPHFEPVIPLPEKVECRTGEEGQELMFCERCKLFRYDSDASQWKERGVGDIKILFNPSSGRYRILMRREHVFKLCANHMLSVDMALKPFPNSDRAWLWTTLADFSEEVAAAETLGARFKTRQIATEFKDAFNKALQTLISEVENIASSAKPEVKKTDQGTRKKREDETTKKQNEDCLLVYEVRSSMANREKASRLFLPSNFLNYTKQELCPGCLGCCRIAKGSTKLSKKKGEQCPLQSLKEHIRKPEKSGSGSASHVFGKFSTVGQLTFSSVKPKESDTFSLTQDNNGSKPFKGAATQLFAEISEDVEGQDENKLHFEPVILLPDEIQVVTGEEGLEVLFTERAKLYRFDGDSGQWKKGGVGDVKLLRHAKSGQGRVLMRREQIKTLCANHNINSGIELKRNVRSDRSWVWYTPADYAEGEARPEKLAITFKSAEIARKFKEVFEDLKKTFFAGQRSEVEVTGKQQGAGCDLHKEFISSFAVSSDVWTCEMCYVENSSKDSKCIACNSTHRGAGFPEPLSKTAQEDAKVALTSTNSSVVESAEPNTFQDFNKDSNPGGSIFQSPGVKGLATSQLFTIGRGESSEDKVDDEMYLSPSKTSSPSKQGMTPHTPSTPSFQENVVTSLPFGTNTPAKFTFSLQVSPESSSHRPKSPLSHASPLSPGSPGNAEDDGPHFEPVIPLPEKVECRTGEEGQEVMFCERCKLFRYDSDASQWKERGVGDIKILFNPSSGRYRILMRREHVFKLCANHMLSVDMALKPFPNSDRAWLWTTLADFSEEVAAAETLGARFKTRQIATEFKDTFDKALQTLISEVENIPSSAKPEVEKTDQGTGKKREDDISIVFERGDDQKQRAKRLELPNNFFGFEDSSPGSDASQQSQPAAIDPKEISTPSQPSLLFGSPSVASLSFQSVAASSFGSSPFGHKTQQKSPGFTGAGAQLFASQNTEDDNSTVEGDHDRPHFEPIIPLPDKIDVKTGEEDEEVMFSNRAKLYRFVADDKQWKERGVGDIKLLRNRPSGKMRVLMRRDQVLKICANHQITTDMKLKPNAGSDRSWVWSTLADFSEQECKAEQLAVRFKSEDIAKQFKEKFEECQELLKNQTPVKTVQKERGEEEVKEDLLTRFKATEGSWECNICMVRNDSDKFDCAACSALKPGAQPSQDQKKDTKTSLFGSTGQSSGSVFSLASATSSTGAGFSFGSAGTSQGDARFISFGSFGETENSKLDTPIRFGFFQQEERVTEKLTEDNKESDSQTVEETPRHEVEDEKDEQAQNVQDTDSTTDEAQGEDSNKEETKPTDERSVVPKEKFEECHGLLKNQTPVKTVQKEEEVNEDLLTKFRTTEGSWECDICMVRNESNKVECAACGGLKAGTQPRTDQKKDMKSWLPFESSHGSSTLSIGPRFSFNQSRSYGVGFALSSPKTSHSDTKPISSFSSFNQAPNSGVPVTFSSFGQGGNVSEQRVRSKKVSFNETPSYGAGISFGLPKSSQNDTKPSCSFGSISQTPNLSSGVPVRFGSFGQKGNASEKTVETKKVSFNQTPSYGAGISFGSPKSSQSDTKLTYSFVSISQTPTLSSGVPVSFGSFGQSRNSSEQTVETQKVSFNQTPSYGAVFSFGSPKSSQIDTKPTYSFGSISQTPNLSSGVPVSFGSFGQGGNVSEEKVEKEKVPFRSAFASTETGPFSSAMQSAERGYCFRSTSSIAGAGFSFAPTTSTAGAGVFGSTSSTVGAGGLFGWSTSSAGGLFVSTSSAQSTHPMFSFGLATPSTSSS